jgi:hypothetical protein
MKKIFKSTKLNYSNHQGSLSKKRQKDLTVLKDESNGVNDSEPLGDPTLTGQTKLFRDEINFQLDLLLSSSGQPNIQLLTAQSLFHYLISKLDDESQNFINIFIPDSLVIEKIVRIFESLSQKRKKESSSSEQRITGNEISVVLSIYRWILLSVLLMISNYLLISSKKLSFASSSNHQDRRKYVADTSIFSFRLFEIIANFPVSPSNMLDEVTCSSLPYSFVDPKLDSSSCYTSPLKPTRKEEPLSSVSGGNTSFRSKRKFGSNTNSNSNSNSNSVVSSPSLCQTAIMNAHNGNGVSFKGIQDDIYSSPQNKSIISTPFESPTKSIGKITSSAIDIKSLFEIWPELYVGLYGNAAGKHDSAVTERRNQVEEICQLSALFLTTFMRAVMEEISSSLTFSTSSSDPVLNIEGEEKETESEELWKVSGKGMQVEEWKSLLFRVQSCIFSVIPPTSFTSSSSQRVDSNSSSYTFKSLNSLNKRNTPLSSSLSSDGTFQHSVVPYYLSFIGAFQVNEILAVLKSSNSLSSIDSNNRISEISLSLQRFLEFIETSCHDNKNNQVSTFFVQCFL